MKQKILVPVDVEEPRSWIGVLPELRLHARTREVDLTAATVVPELGTVIAQAAQAAPFASALPADLRDKALVVARERLKKMTDTDEFGPIRRIVRSGKIYSELLKVAEEISADLIVILSNVPDLGDYLLGPNVAKVARHATCSVLVVRPKNSDASQ